MHKSALICPGCGEDSAFEVDAEKGIRGCAGCGDCWSETTQYPPKPPIRSSQTWAHVETKVEVRVTNVNTPLNRIEIEGPGGLSHIPPRELWTQYELVDPEPLRDCEYGQVWVDTKGKVVRVLSVNKARQEVEVLVLEKFSDGLEWRYRINGWFFSGRVHTGTKGTHAARSGPGGMAVAMAHYPQAGEIWTLQAGKALDIPDGPNIGRMSCGVFTHRGERIRISTNAEVHSVDQKLHRVFVSAKGLLDGKGYWVPVLELWKTFTPPVGAMDDYPWPPPQIPDPPPVAEECPRPARKEPAPNASTRWGAVLEDWLPR